MRITTLLCLVPLCLIPTAAVADPTAEAPPEPLWKGSVGLSYLATGGNADTQSLGSSLSFERRPTPWGLTIGADFSRAEKDSEKTAERYLLRLRGERSLGSRWSLFGGASGERDRFAGFDSRIVVEAGATFRALDGPRHELSVDGGITWTSEDREAGATTDAVGALLAIDYAWRISESTRWTERLVYYPNFEDSEDWRLTYQTALEAALSNLLALKVGYELRYDNEPVSGFEDTDTTFTTSLVVKFPSPAE